MFSDTHPLSLRRTHLVLLALLGTGLAAILGTGQHRGSVAPAPVPGSVASEQAARRTLAAMPLVFEENVGQAPGEIQFLARGGGFALGLSGIETTVSLQGNNSPHRRRGHGEKRSRGLPRHSSPTFSTDLTEAADNRLDDEKSNKPTVVKTRLVGANPHAKSRGEKRLAAKINYFLGNDPKKWHTDVPAYEEVRTTNVYPGIDVVHYGRQNGALEYDFVVAPGADPGDIHFAVEGAKHVSLDKKRELVVATSTGELRQQRPVCYQEIGNTRVSVEADFRLIPTRGTQDSDAPQVSFRLGDYDPTRPLIIDPVLVYSSFLGGSSGETQPAIAIDGGGRAYVAGTTTSTDFPTTAGKYSDASGGIFDLFVTVLDPAQSGAASLVYSTYLGGGNWDFFNALAVDASGRACVTGGTVSSDFPTTSGKLQGDQAGFDAILAVLDPSQDGIASLAYSTYLGGGNQDGGDSEGGTSVAVDRSGRVYLTGSTNSTDFPTSTGAFQRDTGDQATNAFVTVVDPSQSGASCLVYSTYLGSGGETGHGIAVDENGRAYVTGATVSPDFPTTPGRYQGDLGGTADVFVAVVDPSQSGSAALVYSTLLGGSDFDLGSGIAVDALGRAYVTGWTASADFPTTSDKYQDAQASEDAFVTLIDPAESGMTSLVYSTYLGGKGLDSGAGIAVSGNGKVYIAGYTESTDFPVKGGGSQVDPGDNKSDVFVAVMDCTKSGAAGLVWATYLGGGDEDGSWNDVSAKVGIALDGAARVYVASSTSSADFPTTSGKYQSYQGNGDAFVSILAPELPPADPTALTATAVSSTRINVAWTDNSSDEAGFKIERKQGAGAFAQIATVGANVTNYGNTGLSPSTAYTYRVRGYLGGVSSAFTNEATATTPGALAAPTGLAATAVTSARIDLAWTDNSSDETGFKIERKTGSGSFAVIYTAAAGSISHSNTGLAASTTYTYRVQAYRSADYSAYTNEAAATTLPLPLAPTNLTAAAVTSARINLDWTDKSSDETGFQIDRKTGSGAFGLVANVGPNVVSYASTGLAAATTYTYRVRAYRSTDFSAYSNEASATTPALPAAPTGLTATAVSTTRINLAWTDKSTDETGFQIERKTGGGTFAVLTNQGANVTTYANTGLTASTAYTYRVRAYRATDFSANSNEAAATTPALPAAPSDLAATPVSSTRINLAWTDRSNDETGFRIERKAGGGAFGFLANVGANITTYANTPLSISTAYIYRVRAYRGAENSVFSNEASATTLALPARPSGLTAKPVSSTRINIAWTDNSSDETGFQIERKTGGGAFAPLSNVGANVIAYANTGLTASTAYTYRVRASRGTDTSTYSNEATATTPALPPAPSGLTATAVSSTRINLAWSDNSSDEAGFQIERKNGFGGFAPVGNVGANVTTFGSTGLTASTAYTYRVRASRTSDTSAYSNEATATTLALPQATTGLTAVSISSARINLTWADNSGDETGFQIERKTGGGAFSIVANVGANVTTYANTGLSANTTYYYRVRATRNGDTSAYSNEATATTLPLPSVPSGLSATPVSSTRIDLSWVDNSSDETGFRIERKTSGAFSAIASVGANATTFGNTGLGVNTTYTYRVRAYRGSDTSTYSDEASATTLALPVAPDRLTAKTVSGTRIDLAWSDHSTDENGFQIERKTGSGAFGVLTTVGRNVTTYVNTGLAGGTAYTYRVRAYRSTDTSAYSNQASATTLPLPAAPSGLTAKAVSSGQINLAWTDNSGNETGFEIERKKGDSVFVVISTVPANGTNLADVYAAANTTYTYRVRAYRGSDYSAYSNEARATTLR